MVESSFLHENKNQFSVGQAQESLALSSTYTNIPQFLSTEVLLQAKEVING